MAHHCPIASCSIDNVPAGVFMCARHWRMVPKPLQAAVYESFRREGRISANHREAVRVVEAAEADRCATGLPAGMKALTLWQPWASLIMIGAKPYEFRKWNFADKPHLEKLIDQRIVIHAGARTWKRIELEDIVARIDEGESALVPEIARPYIASVLEGAEVLPLAAALGTAVIGRPQRSFDLFKHIVADSDRLDHQMYAWPVSSVQPFERSIPASGAQGFWNWS